MVYKQRATTVIKLLRKYNPKAKTLLELACGTGNFTKQLAKVGFNILEVQYNFAGCPESMLFVVQKKK